MRRKPCSTPLCTHHSPKKPSSSQERLESAATWNEAKADEWRRDGLRARSEFVRKLAFHQQHRHEAQALSLWHRANQERTHGHV